MESEEEKLRSCFVLQLTINVPVFYYEWRGFKSKYYKQYEIQSSNRCQNYFCVFLANLFECYKEGRFLMTLKEWLIPGTAEKLFFLSPKGHFQGTHHYSTLNTE